VSLWRAAAHGAFLLGLGDVEVGSVVSTVACTSRLCLRPSGSVTVTVAHFAATERRNYGRSFQTGSLMFPLHL